MLHIKQLNVTNPKDKILGAQAMFGELDVELPLMDYTQTEAELFTIATRAWIVHYQTLECLIWACTSRKTPRMPSWAIDWASQTLVDFTVIGSMYSSVGASSMHNEDKTATRHSKYPIELSGIDYDNQSCSFAVLSWTPSRPALVLYYQK